MISAVFHVDRHIAAAPRRMPRLCIRTESGFDTLNVYSLWAEYQTGKKDFNDQVLEDLCSRRGFSLVTDDSDFKAANLTLFTANFKLLNP